MSHYFSIVKKMSRFTKLKSKQRYKEKFAKYFYCQYFQLYDNNYSVNIHVVQWLYYNTLPDMVVTDPSVGDCTLPDPSVVGSAVSPTSPVTTCITIVK